MMKLNKIILFLTIAIVFSENYRPLSLEPFDLNSSGVIYGRGTYMIVLPTQSLESYLTNENYGGDFVKHKKSQGYNVEIVNYNQVASRSLQTASRHCCFRQYRSSFVRSKSY